MLTSTPRTYAARNVAFAETRLPRAFAESPVSMPYAESPFPGSRYAESPFPGARADSPFLDVGASTPRGNIDFPERALTPQLAPELLPDPCEHRGGALLHVLQKIGGQRPDAADVDLRPRSAKASQAARRGIGGSAATANVHSRRIQELCGTRQGSWQNSEAVRRIPSIPTQASGNANKEDVEVDEIYRKVFESIHSRGGDDHAAKILSSTPVDGQIAIDGSEFYTVQLPPRPCVIKVHVERISGYLPIVYGSTSGRPTTRSYDFKSANGEVTCRHLCGLPQNELASAAQTAPKNLSLLLTSSSGVCEFRIRCSVRREGGGMDGGAMKQRLVKNRVEDKLNVLRNDAHERGVFMERIHQQNCEKAAAQRRGLRRFDKWHNELMRPESRQQTFEHHKEQLRRAAERREEVEKERESRMQRWVDRTESRRQERLAAEALAVSSAASLQVQARWFELSFALLKRGGNVHERAEFLIKERAAIVLQRKVLPIIAHRRSVEVLNNIVIFRTGLAAFVRHARLGVFNVSSSKMNLFLHEHTQTKPDSIHENFIKFTNKIKRLQRRIRRWIRSTNARVEMLQEHFTAAALINARRNYCRSGTRTTKGGSANSLMLEPSSNMDEGLSFMSEYAGEELLPQWLRTLALKSHVRQMERGHAKRIQHWIDLVAEALIEASTVQDLMKMGMASSVDIERTKQPPRPKLLELEHLPDVYCATLRDLKAGVYKGEQFYRNRITMTVFYSWRRIQVQTEGRRQSQAEERQQQIKNKTRTISIALLD